jgi:hypothetical protein
VEFQIGIASHGIPLSSTPPKSSDQRIQLRGFKDALLLQFADGRSDSARNLAQKR